MGEYKGRKIQLGDTDTFLLFNRNDEEKQQHEDEDEQEQPKTKKRKGLFWISSLQG